MKTCSRCKESRPPKCFPKRRASKDGLGSLCKACTDEATKRWRRRNPDRVRQYNRRSGLAKYGLTQASYDELLAAQGSVCAICEKQETQKLGTLSVDHDHRTGQVRALLCHHCNTALGKMNDDPLLLRKAADYLEVWSHQSSVA